MKNIFWIKNINEFMTHFIMTVYKYIRYEKTLNKNILRPTILSPKMTLTLTLEILC